MADTIDAALDILHHTGPDYSGGTNHGPMAAEALLAMGRPEAILPWVEGYKRRLTDRPTPSAPMARAEWHEALGDRKRVADWIAFFARELADASWPDVVHRWVPVFAPGLMAAAALRLLLPYLAEADARLAARYAWQACAALYVWYATTSGPSSTTLEHITESRDALIDRAIAAEGAHSIKFTEACLREYAIDPKPVYLVAARDVAERVGAR